MRKCTNCGKEMDNGYCIDNGLEYYCSDECLHAFYSPCDYLQLCKEDLAYWTEWED